MIGRAEARAVARGWESKAIEAQQDEAREKARVAAPADRRDPRASAERATLALARARALADLQHACAPAHRAMLEQTIAAIDDRLRGT
jgi:hypothetical protein